MRDYFDRTRTALRHLLGTRPDVRAESPGISVSIGDDLVLADGGVAFANPDRAATDPTAWLAALEAALERHVPIGDAALELIRAQAGRLSADTMLWGSVERSAPDQPPPSAPRLVGAPFGDARVRSDGRAVSGVLWRRRRDT